MTIKTFSRYVTRNNKILGGEPIIEGTRTSVRAIVGLWRYRTPIAPPDWTAIYANPHRPLHLYIGCGRSKFLLAMAHSLLPLL